MMNLSIEHFVAGAPMSERGDGTLSYTVGVSSAAEQLSQCFDSKMPADHAVFLMLVNPDTNLNTFIHAQGDYTVFAGQGRAYCTRAVYEMTRESHGAAGLDNRFVPVVASLDRMRQYQEREFGQSNLVVADETLGREPLTLPEEQLYSVLVHAVVNNQQVFIRLSEGDKRQGDELRKSPKFLSLLRVIDQLPRDIRGYVSMGFSLEADLNVSRIFADHLLVIAHHDDMDAWGKAGADGIAIDWQGDEPRIADHARATKAEELRLKQVAPLINTFLGNGRPTRNAVMGMMKLIPENVDRLLGNGDNPSDNDIKILKALYDSPSPETYRQTEAAAKLLRWKERGVKVPVALAEVLDRFPSLEEDVMRLLSTRVKQAVNYQQLVMLYRDNSNVKGLLEVIRQRVLSSRAMMDEVARMATEPLSKALQDAITDKAKGYSMREKLDRMNMEYYQLSIDDLSVAGWEDYVQIIDYLRSHGKEDQIKQFKPDAASWSVDTVDADIYRTVVDTLDNDGLRALNAKLLQRRSAMPLELLRLVVAHLAVEDADTLMDIPDAKFVPIMDMLLDGKDSFVHLPEAAALRSRYISLKALDTPLREIPAAVWGTEDGDMPTLIKQVVPTINYGGKRVERLTDDINWVLAHLEQLPTGVKSHLEKAVQAYLKGSRTTLLQVARLVAKIDPRLKLNINMDAIKSLGNVKELKVAIEELEQKGHSDLATKISDRYHVILEDKAVSSFNDAVAQLKKQPYQYKAFASHTSDSLLAVIEKNPFSLKDYFQLTTLLNREYISKAIESAGQERLFAEVIGRLEQNHAAEWLQDNDNGPVIAQVLKNKNSIEYAILKKLINALNSEQKAEFKERFADFYTEPFYKKVFGKMKGMRTILAVSLMALAGVLFMLKYGNPIGTGAQLADSIVTEPVPAWLLVKSRVVGDSIDHIDSCKVSDRHLMSMLADWYEAPFIKGKDRFDVEIHLQTAEGWHHLPLKAVTPMTRVGNLWAIDSLYYHYLPVEQRNAAFFDAKIVTENNDTIDVSYNMPLLRVASDRQLSQQVKQVLVGEDSITIDNQVFQDKNGKRRDMNYTVYSLWLINQIDDACKQINTTKLFPF